MTKDEETYLNEKLDKAFDKFVEIMKTCRSDEEKAYVIASQVAFGMKVLHDSIKRMSHPVMADDHFRETVNNLLVNYNMFADFKPTIN